MTGQPEPSQSERESCDYCGTVTAERTCPKCGHLTCEVEAMQAQNGRDPNAATAAERAAIKLARSLDEAGLRRTMGEVMSHWTPEQLRRHGAATFVLARRKGA